MLNLTRWYTIVVRYNVRVRNAIASWQVPCPGKIPTIKDPLDASNFDGVSAEEEAAFMAECAGAAAGLPDSTWKGF